MKPTAAAACALLAAFAVEAPAADVSRLPPAVPATPDFRTLPGTPAPPAIFVYRVDRGCRVTGARKLQGPESLSWRDVQQQHQIELRQVVWRIVDGVRSQLVERRVKLRGELVREGELVCHVRPAGQVLEAWIERADDSAARRRTTRREPVAVQDGYIADLGTYSLTIDD
jgi:hypothetical protein